MPQTIAQARSLVCIAAPQDVSLLSSWENHLRPLQRAGQITFWSERAILPGEDRAKQILLQMEKADIIAFFVSVDMFASEECMAWLDVALQRSQTHGVTVLPVLVRPCTWRDSDLGSLSCLPANEVPVKLWDNEDEGWLACVEELQRRFGLSLQSLSESASAKQDHSDRGIALARLHWDYQKELDTSLERLVWQELSFHAYPGLVHNATQMKYRRPDQSESSLPPGMSILQVYDASAKALLILGEPGAGKSTLLTWLALQLVERSQANETHPLPVILPLSSWAEHKPALEPWLVDQMANRYEIPRLVGQRWLEHNHLVLLLDGLDEMDETARPRCIAAINTYRKTHLTPLVVCSRTDEYQAASTQHRLVLQNAVVVQALTQEQIEAQLQQGGTSLATLRKALLESQEFQVLANTPLMLSVLILAYQNTTPSDFPQQDTGLEQQVWQRFVTRMLTEKGANYQGKGDIIHKRYEPEQTRSWLSWLARQMRAHNRTWFFGEDLEGSWLDASPSCLIRWLFQIGPAILVGALTTMLLGLVFVGIVETSDLIQQGLTGGFFGWYLSQSAASAQRSRLRLQRSHFVSSLLFGLLQTVTFHYLWTMGDALICGCLMGGSAWILQSRLAQLQSLTPPVSQPSTNLWSHITGWMRTIPGRQAISAGLLFGIGYGLSLGLSFGLNRGLSLGLSFGLNRGLSLGLSFWLLHLVLRKQPGVEHLTERIHWTRRALVQWSHLSVSLLITLVCICFFGLSNGLSLGLSNGLFEGLSVVGLSDGLRYGLRTGLSYGLHYGLSSGLTTAALPYLILCGVWVLNTWRLTTPPASRNTHPAIHKPPDVLHRDERRSQKALHPPEKSANTVLFAHPHFEGAVSGGGDLHSPHSREPYRYGQRG